MIRSSFGSDKLSNPKWESATVALPLVAPPDKPVPATTAVMSPVVISEYLASPVSYTHLTLPTILLV